MEPDLAELEERVGAKRFDLLLVTELENRALRRSFAAPGGLLRFVRHFWPVLEPSTVFKEGWALEAMCVHLEAVADGRINRLLINIPPGSCKSLLCSVFFPVWIWSAKEYPSAKFLNLSYAAALPERDNRSSIRLIQSDEFKRLYGKRFSLDKAGEQLIETSKRGCKQAAGIGGTVTGRRGDFLIYDDPNNVIDVESEVIREAALTSFREAVVSRLNDMVKSAIIVIQQRSHEDDVSGMILQEGWPYVHLMIPLLYEPDRHCETEIGWSDPRTEDGENYWPERYPAEAVQMAMDTGDFAFSGQFQQRPEPRGGGILKREYWRDWDPEPNPATGRREFPQCDFVLASLDPAFTSKQQNDPSGFGIWGCFREPDGKCGVILLDAFAKRLELCGPEPISQKDETYEAFKARTQDGWGIVETVFDRCRRFRVNVLLVESKASGLSVIQVMEKLFLRRRFQIQAIDPDMDKMRRVVRVQPEFSGGYVHAPMSKSWAMSVVNECATFPRGSHDDQVDQTTQAIYWLRTNGFLERSEEQFVSREESMKKYKQTPPLYSV